MNNLVVYNEDGFFFSAREVLKDAGIDKSHISRAIKRNILGNETLELGVDYIENTTYSGSPTGRRTTSSVSSVKVHTKSSDYLLTKKAMEFVLISLQTSRANNLRKQLIEKMNEVQAVKEPRVAINDGLKIAYALIEAEKMREKAEKESDLLVIKAKGKRKREEIIAKINELAKKIGYKFNNGNYRAVYSRLYRAFAATNKRAYWGYAMQAKNHLEYIGEMGGVQDLQIIHEILVSFVEEDSSFFADDRFNSVGERRNKDD